MMMMFVAGSERIPTDSQLNARLGEKNYEDLKCHALHNGYDLRYIMEKVMEDVFSANSLRRMGNKRQQKYRETHKSNALHNSSPNANITPGDKIREDKNNTYIQDFFTYYLLKTKRQFRLTNDCKRLIEGRLKEGFTTEQLKKAVDNFILDPWEGRKAHMDLIYCIGKQKGKPDNLEHWLNYKPQPKTRIIS